MSPNLFSIQNFHFLALIFLFAPLLLTLLTSASSDHDLAVSYSGHCSSIIPPPEKISHQITSPFGPFITGYYTGGHRVINLNISRFANSFSFLTLSVHGTNKDSVFKVAAGLIFRSYHQIGFDLEKFKALDFRNPGSDFTQTPLGLSLEGFWSANSGEVCMVGEGFAHPKPGILIYPKAVLKLSNVSSSSNVISLVTGTLEISDSSHDSRFFGLIHIVMFPWMNYKYTLASKAEPLAHDIVKGLAFSVLPSKRFCSIFSSNLYQFNSINAYELQYPSNCSKVGNCNPLGGSSADDLPNVVSIKTIECSESKRKVRVLIEFVKYIHSGYRQVFDPHTSLIGEGLWDDRGNQVVFSACRFLNMVASWSSVRIGDCSMRLSLRFTSVLSIRDTSTVVGKIWSTENTGKESQFLGPILFSRTERNVVSLPGLLYQYTEMDRVSKICQSRKTIKRESVKYPGCYSSDLKFDIKIRNSSGFDGSGYAIPFAIGDHFYQQLKMSNPSNPVNVSYKIGVRLYAAEQDTEHDTRGVLQVFQVLDEMEVSAEGIYDQVTGNLCMTGCRKIVSSVQNSFDCEIRLSFQFPPVNPARDQGYVEGSIESTRSRIDPLFFKPLKLASAAYNTATAKQSLSRMDLEITMVIICNTLTCIFVGFQLYHMKKNPGVVPSVSVTMASILTIGYTLPILMQLKHLASQINSGSLALQETGKWLEGDAAITKITAIVAVLLRVRLLGQTLSARSKDVNRNRLWQAEKRSLLASFPIYLAGTLITLLAKWMKTKHILDSGDFTVYAGFLLDGFLLPQVIFNVVLDAGTSALTPTFYVGTTLVRLLPHVYDLYRKIYFSEDFEATYIFANRVVDLYSVVWDLIFPAAGLLFAAVIYLQQSYGGRFILPRKYRDVQL